MGMANVHIFKFELECSVPSMSFKPIGVQLKRKWKLLYNYLFDTVIVEDIIHSGIYIIMKN